MFEKIFKKNYKSRKSVSAEEAEEMKSQLQRLQEDNKLREAQLIRLGKLLQEDPVNKERYAKRILIHNRIINENKQTIQEIELKLLDS